jgi:hypothetical protein
MHSAPVLARMSSQTIILLRDPNRGSSGDPVTDLAPEQTAGVLSTQMRGWLDEVILPILSQELFGE